MKNSVMVIATGLSLLCLHDSACAARSPRPKHLPISEAAKAGAVAAAAVPRIPQPAAVAPVVLPPMTVERIVERNVAARGGLPAWRRVTALSMAGRLESGTRREDGGTVGLSSREIKAMERRRAALVTAGRDNAAAIELPFRLDLQRPHNMRLEVSFAGQNALQVYDGSQGWKVRPYLGRRDIEQYTPEELSIAASEQPLDGPLIDHAVKGIRVASEGAELVDGRKAYRLKLTMPNGDTRRLWIDGATFLDLQIEGAPRRFDGRYCPVTTVFKDYQAVDGVQVARLLETRVQGSRQVEHIRIEKVVINPGLDKTSFAKPV